MSRQHHEPDREPAEPDQPPAEPNPANQPLPFTFLQFFWWALAVLELIVSYQIASAYWQELVVQQGHGRVYFILRSLGAIAIMQLYFVPIYYVVKFLTRFHRRG